MSQYAHETRILSETRTEALRKYEYKEKSTHNTLHIQTILLFRLYETGAILLAFEKFLQNKKERRNLLLPFHALNQKDVLYSKMVASRMASLRSISPRSASLRSAPLRSAPVSSVISGSPPLPMVRPGLYLLKLAPLRFATLEVSPNQFCLTQIYPLRSALTR